MKLSKALITTAAAMAAVGVGGGVAQATEDEVTKFDNGSQILSCDTVEIIDIPILSSANNGIDCSENTKHEEHKSVHIVEDKSAKAAVLLPRGEHDYR